MAEDRLGRAVSEEANQFRATLADVWGHFSRQWKIWVAAGCLNLLISAGIVGAALLTWLIFHLDGYLTLLVVVALLGLFAGGLCRMALRQLRGETISIGDAFTFRLESLYLMGASVMLLLIGTPALIFGGARNLLLTFPLIVDRGRSVGDALSESWQTLSHARQPWNALAFVTILLTFGALAAGSLALVIAFPVAAPLFWLWIAALYRDCYPCPRREGKQV